MELNYESEAVAFNDPRILMESLLEDASSLYRTIFVLEYYELMTGPEIALSVNRPQFQVDAIREHLNDLYQLSLSALEKEISCEN